MKKNIVLIGFMGVGKSTIGHKLAKRLNYKFVDTDRVIEELTGKTIEQIFRIDGEKRFRSEEKLLVQKIARQTGLVIATGGGLVLDQENMDLLKQNGVIIHLTADPEVIMERVKNKQHRPLLNTDNLLETIQKLSKERAGAYAIAEFTLDSGKYTITQAVSQIITDLKKMKF